MRIASPECPAPLVAPSWPRVWTVSRQSPARALSLAADVLFARWRLRHATAVGTFVQLRGRLRVVNRGRLIVEDRVRFHADVATSELVVLDGGELRIGAGTFVNYGAEFCARVAIDIGPDCRIGTHCIIIDNDFHQIALAHRDEPAPGIPIALAPQVWIGNRVTILKGVQIGRGSVVAAGSVVTRSLPPLCIAAGVPARVIGRVDGGR